LKASLRGQTFESDKDVIHTIDDWFEQLDEQFFMYGIKAFAHHWEKCVTLGGDYVEKLQSNFVRGPLFLCFFSNYLLINLVFVKRHRQSYRGPRPPCIYRAVIRI